MIGGGGVGVGGVGGVGGGSGGGSCGRASVGSSAGRAAETLSTAQPIGVGSGRSAAAAGDREADESEVEVEAEVEYATGHSAGPVAGAGPVGAAGASGVVAPAPELSQEARPVAEVEGLRLHRSSRARSGYKGVFEEKGRFRAQRTVDGKSFYIGLFDTAVEAARAYARVVGEVAPAGSKRRRGPSPTSGELAAEIGAAGASSGAAGSSPPLPKQHKPASAVAVEAGGMRLHLSSSSSTGYKGVCKVSSGRFMAQVTRRDAQGKRDGLGTFDTAVGAAIEYARAVGEAEDGAAGFGWEALAAAAGNEEAPIEGGAAAAAVMDVPVAATYALADVEASATGASSSTGEAAANLPPGWSSEHRTLDNGRKYLVYYGPQGERAVSVPDAWRKQRREPAPKPRKRSREDKGATSVVEEAATLPCAPLCAAEAVRGAKVVVYYADKKRWIRGQVKAVNADGSFTVLFEDGDEDWTVPLSELFREAGVWG